MKRMKNGTFLEYLSDILDIQGRTVELRMAGGALELLQITRRT